MNSRHSAAFAAWATPEPIIAAARTVLGRIDLDPASDAAANARVRAVMFYDEQQNGLRSTWDLVGCQTVFLNPPGGSVKLFWRKLQAWIAADTLRRAIWVGYSLEQLQTLQIGGPGPIETAAAICYPRKRIAFLDAAGVPRNGPTHANYIAALGINGAGRFRATFEQFGEVR